MRIPPKFLSWFKFLIIVFVGSYVLLFTLAYYYEKGGLATYLTLCVLLVASATLIANIIIVFKTIESLDLTKQSLELTRKTLELTAIEINTRVRPFISATQILPLTTENFGTEGFAIILSNTGTIPAAKLEVNVSLMNMDNAPIEGGVSTGCSLLAPSAEFQANVVKLHQQIINSRGLRVQIYTRYQGLDRS